MIVTLENGVRFDASEPIDISIPLDFNGPQPNAYGVEPARSEPVEAGPLVGDTRRGGSCNFERYTFIPHCSGTHTECVGHITRERISVRECLKDVFVPATLISVQPEPVGDDLVITKAALKTAVGKSLQGATAAEESVPGAVANGPTSDKESNGRPREALIVRTFPNDDGKLSRTYNGAPMPPYFAAEAIAHIVDLGVAHLIVDLPSIDRLFDDGKLENHRIFWNVQQGSFETNAGTRIKNTITELAYIPNEIADGRYALNLQIAPFASDCAPSRPVIFPLV